MRMRIIVLLLLGSLSCTTYTGARESNGIAWYGNAARDSVGANEVPGPKRGDACNYNIYGLVSFGNASLQKAKANGGLRSIATVDVDFTNIFWAFGRYCTIVTGE